MTTRLAADSTLYADKTQALGKLGIKAEGQIWDVRHSASGQTPSEMLMAYMRIASMQVQIADRNPQPSTLS